MPSARNILLILSAMGLFACSTLPKETEKGKAVKVIKDPFTETCIQLGMIRYDGTPFIHDKELSLVMRELTAQMKGNAMRLDTFTPGVTGVSHAKGRGTAYRCRKNKLKKYIQGQEDNSLGDEIADDPEFKEAKEAKEAKSGKGSKK